MISTINENVREIESLRASALSSINGEHSSQVNQMLDDLVSKTSKLNINTKNCIKGITQSLDLSLILHSCPPFIKIRYTDAILHVEVELANAKQSLNSSDRHMRATQVRLLRLYTQNYTEMTRI